MRLPQLHRVFVLLLVSLCVSVPAIVGQSPAEVANRPALIWKDPGDVAAFDFTYGPGGADLIPQGPFRFIEAPQGGTSPKVTVSDKNDRVWAVKFGVEAPAETFSMRLAWAAGYWVQPTYLVVNGRILNAESLEVTDRARPYINRQTGAFVAGRFQLRDKESPKPMEGDGWDWNKNPFRGTRELNGLKILMLLTSNWDPKDADQGGGSNTAIFDATQHDGQLYYVFTDWGATMGRWGNLATRDKWDCSGYAKQSRDFIKAVNGNVIEWGYSGKKKRDIAEGLTVDDVRWLMQYLGRLTDEQLRAGLLASGADEKELECYQHAIRDRLAQLQYVAETGQSPQLAKQR